MEKKLNRGTKTLFLAGLVFVFISLVAAGGKEEAETAAKASLNNNIEKTPRIEVDQAIENKIGEIISDVDGAEMRKIHIQQNDTGEFANGYHATVHAAFDRKRDESVTKQSIVTTTDVVSANLIGTPGLERMDFFWEVPELQKNKQVIKITFEKQNGVIVKTDEWFDETVFNY